MDKILELKKQLVEALLDYYIDQHNKDIEELEHSYTIYNTEMKKLYGEKFWDIVEIQNSIRNCFSITDKFVVDNIQLITNNGIGYYDDYKIVYNVNTNYITLINLTK